MVFTAVELFHQNIPATQTPLASREGITFIESVLRESFPEEEWKESFPMRHRFSDGVYAREMIIPKGHIIVGKIHKFAHINVITKGQVSVLTEFGVETLQAPATFISKPGTKRVVFAHEDTTWTTFHGTQHTDPDDVEEDIICKSFDEYDAYFTKQLEQKS